MLAKSPVSAWTGSAIGLIGTVTAAYLFWFVSVHQRIRRIQKSYSELVRESISVETEAKRLRADLESKRKLISENIRKLETLAGKGDESIEAQRKDLYQTLKTLQEELDE